MKDKLHRLIFICFFIVFTNNACKMQKKTIVKNRFDNYVPLTDKEDTLNATYIQWAVEAHPNFIKQTDFLRFHNTKDSSSSDSLIKYCFFLDTKDSLISNFTGKETHLLSTNHPVTLYGKFYKTKKFDEIFPFKGWSIEDFKPDTNGYYKVFMYRKYTFN